MCNKPLHNNPLRLTYLNNGEEKECCYWLYILEDDSVMYITGVSSQNQLLFQMTTDATQRPFIAGPVEAIALGNGSRWENTAQFPRYAPWSANRLIL